MREEMRAGTVVLEPAGRDPLQAYLATPVTDRPHGGVVVIHHIFGYDRATKEIARRFAELGYDALVPNLNSREGFDVASDDAASAVRSRGGIPDDQLVGDVGVAVDHLRGLPGSNGKIGVIGYCSGGRQTVLVACTLDVDAAVDCYGAFVVGPTDTTFGIAVTGLDEQLPELRAPLLGLFGNDDKYPGPAEVQELAEILERHGKAYEFHQYDDAAHSFFANDRPGYRVEAANDGWERIAAFFATHLTV
ncbi:dienelactone hydrolase family protein [Streptomyces sp. NPDC051985]|uniref:dienelactone hydrolase family protein n=1 Tax=Streptomyces sp. NPDC051985 TaxID=3155807 RepID=UPI003429E45E